MLQPLPTENIEPQKKRLKVKFTKRPIPKSSDYPSDQKQLIKISKRLKVLGKSPDKFPHDQFKHLIDEAKNMLYTIKRIELNTKLKRREKKKKK